MLSQQPVGCNAKFDSNEQHERGLDDVDCNETVTKKLRSGIPTRFTCGYDPRISSEGFA